MIQEGSSKLASVPSGGGGGGGAGASAGGATAAASEDAAPAEEKEEEKEESDEDVNFLEMNWLMFRWVSDCSIRLSVCASSLSCRNHFVGNLGSVTCIPFILRPNLS